MKLIRQLLFHLFGIKIYLRIVSKTYILLTNYGFLKHKCPELFYIDTIVKPDWVCIDIGANLGYFSNRIARKLTSGKLYAVEPIPLFAEIWRKNLAHSKSNVEMLNIALGEENKTVSMSIPFKNGVIRHGLTKIDDAQNTVEKKAMTFEVQLRSSGEVFGDLTQIDFIKIDIEGYEFHVLKSLSSSLKKHQPIILAELSGIENRKNSVALLSSIGYTAYKLIEGKLLPIAEKELSSLAQDMYFLPS